MEEKVVNKNRIDVENHQRQEGAQIHLEEVGKLEFKETHFPEQIFGKQGWGAQLVIQRKYNLKLILIHLKNQYKIFKISDGNKKVEFVSAHTIDLPISDDPLRTFITEDKIRFYYHSGVLEEKFENIEFLATNQIDKSETPIIFFESDFGLGQPKLIPPKLYKEPSAPYQGLTSWNITEFLTNKKPLLNTRLCIIEAFREPDVDDFAQNFASHKPDRVFLARVQKTSEKPPQRIFKIQHSFNSLKTYKEKLLRNLHALPEDFRDQLRSKVRFKQNSVITLQSISPGKPQRLSAALSLGQMITIQLMDLRTRKIQARSFVSIYEIFEGQDFTKVTLPFVCSIYKAQYSPELDTLSLDMLLTLTYLNPLTEEMTSIIEAERSQGRKDRTKLTSFSGQDSRREIKYLRFKVSNVFNEGRRIVTMQRIGFRNNFGTEIFLEGCCFMRILTKS